MTKLTEHPCFETLTGALVEMVPDGGGGYTCKACGATEQDIKCCEALIIEDWQRGGTGEFSRTRYAELTVHEGAD